MLESVRCVTKTVGNKMVVLAQWCQLKNLLMFKILLCYLTLENLDDDGF